MRAHHLAALSRAFETAITSETARQIADGFLWVMDSPRRYPDRAVVAGAAFVTLLFCVAGMNVAASIPTESPVTVAHVGKDQSRLPQIDPALARAIFPQPRKLVCEECPIIPRPIPTTSYRGDHYEAKPRASATKAEKKRLDELKKKDKRSDAATGMQLASVNGIDHEPDYEQPTSSGWPRVTPEQEAAIAAARAAEEAETDPQEAWAKGEIDAYLCAVYRRTTIKKDRSGDFTWKDHTAAKRSGKEFCEYVIGGMSPDFREQLYAAGKGMDGDGIKWTMLSAFRDDYRQKIASGFKASGGNSRHGGSRATRGYGDGQAIDIAAVAGTSLKEIFGWIDKFGRALGIYRPMPGYDAAHVQPTGDWRVIAAQLRSERTGETQTRVTSTAPTTKRKTASRKKQRRGRVRYAHR